MFVFRIKRIIKHTRRLCQGVFFCYLSPEYLNNYYSFETNIHKQKRQWLKAKGYIESFSINDQLEELFALILNVAQLRHRVIDYAELIVCEREMQALACAFDQVFLKIFSPKKFSLTVQKLEEKIEDFLAIYQQILTVSAKNYFVYFVFITAINLLYKNIIILQEKLLDLKRI